MWMLAACLNDERIHPGVMQLPGQLASGLELVVAQDGVEGDEDAAVKAMGVLHQPGDVLHAVVGRRARTKRRAADVDSVRAVLDGLDADVGRAGGGEQFELVGEHGRDYPKKQKTRHWAAFGGLSR